ncbi:MAG: ABC transporter ATP-binding protein [Candidatus Limnocylindria bacterium]
MAKSEKDTAAAQGARNGKRLRSGMLRAFVGQEGADVVAPAPPLPVKEIFKEFWPYMRPYRRYLVGLLLLLLLLPLLDGARLYMIKVTVDEVLIPGDLDPFLWIAPIVLGVTILSGAFGYLQSYLVSWVGGRFLLALRTRFFSHLQNLSLSFFEQRSLGDILARLTGDVAAIEAFVVSGLVAAASSVAQLVIFGGALIFLDWRLFIFILVVGPLFAGLVRVLSRLIKRASRETRRRTGAMTAFAEEALGNQSLVQGYNRQKLEIDRFHRENVGQFEAQMLSARARSLFAPATDLIQAVSGLVVLGVGAVAVKNGDLSVGALLVTIAFLQRLYGPMRTLARLYNVIYAASAGAERVIEYLREVPAVTDSRDAKPIGRARGKVEFEDVEFAYPGSDEKALDGISFRADPGQTVALVGHSGAGKSTIARLMLRFHDPIAGHVRIDGVDLKDITVSSLRDNMALLLQETLMFDGTIRENIAYGRPAATDEEIVAAAEAADAHEFIDELEGGYDAEVGQRGRRLSGGQRQRVAIARAMIRDAPILILDEPTTGLDAESSHKILEPLRRLMSSHTTIVISHELLTVREADVILVLDHGKIIERGSHDELMARNGAYTRFVRLQVGAREAREAFSGA